MRSPFRTRVHLIQGDYVFSWCGRMIVRNHLHYTDLIQQTTCVRCREKYGKSRVKDVSK